ncbi:MAG: hypothetical protein JSS81_05495 [Acidobacteria bacterium]|nr:hypothetical protein [Acidobacteriota bacterium]
MKAFVRKNHNIAETMKSHLIEDLEAFGIWNDDYEIFLKKRAKAVSRELKKRIIEQEIDKTAAAELQDEYTEETYL